MRIADETIVPFLRLAIGREADEHPRDTARRILELQRGKPDRGSAPFYGRLRKYGVTDAVDQMMLWWLASGGCWICGGCNTEGKLCIDHSHETGLFRGLLCHRCNLAIGGLGDDPRLVRRALYYLERPEG